jgi:hypothetical protein
VKRVNRGGSENKHDPGEGGRAILSIMPSPCPERRVLSDAVVAAVASVYRAKEAHESAKLKKTADVDQLASALLAARKSGREATRALETHVKKHGC